MRRKGYPAAGNDMIIAAAAQGEPAPPEVVQALKEGGIEAVDEYGLFGWYLRARVALAAGRDRGGAGRPAHRPRLLEQPAAGHLCRAVGKRPRLGPLARRPALPADLGGQAGAHRADPRRAALFSGMVTGFRDFPHSVAAGVGEGDGPSTSNGGASLGDPTRSRDNVASSLTIWSPSFPEKAMV